MPLNKSTDNNTLYYSASEELITSKKSDDLYTTAQEYINNAEISELPTQEES